jgi:hypothetical protein
VNLGLQFGLALLLLQTPTSSADLLLREPGYFIDKQGEIWRLRKPRLRAGPAWIVFEDTFFAAVEQQKRTLPRLRLNRLLVSYHPGTGQRLPVANWSGADDAKEVEADVQDLLRRHAPPFARPMLAATPIYMARLNGASGHTAEEWRYPGRFVIYLDPFRATGRLHAASTIIHELAHVHRYQSRGFHANRAASVLPRADFVLLGLEDESAAYQAEAQFIRSFFNTLSAPQQRSFGRAMPSADLRWPMALTLMLGFEGPADIAARMAEARKQIRLDLRQQAERYWDLHHADHLDPALAKTIADWYAGSPEWSDIAKQRQDWIDAVR